jgi:hypothetical protein
MMQQKSEEERMKTILFAQGLHPFGKMALNFGKRNMEVIVKLNRFVDALARPTSHPHIGIDKKINLLDTNALEIIKFDPIYGYVWYYQEQGEIETFGLLLREGKASDAALGSASEVAAVVQKEKGKFPEVIKKQEVGMDVRPTTELAKTYRKFTETGIIPEIGEIQEIVKEPATQKVEIPVRTTDAPPVINYVGDKPLQKTQTSIAPWKKKEKKQALTETIMEET